MSIKIVIYEDSAEDYSFFESIITSLNHKYESKGGPLNIEVQHYDDHVQLMNFLQHGLKCDIIILDMFKDDEKSNVGVIILDVLKNIDNTIPVIIYTLGMRGALDDIKNIGNEYSFVRGGAIDKKDKVGLAKRIESIIFSRRVVYSYDNDDLIVLNVIDIVGEDVLSNIIRMAVQELNIKEGVVLEGVVSGYSGALLLRLSRDNSKPILLKLSKNIKKAIREHEQALHLYREFPDHVIHAYFNKAIQVDDFYAFMFNEVCGGDTLFAFLSESDDLENIEQIFHELFLSGHGLSYHYLSHLGEEKKYTFLLEGMFVGCKKMLVKVALNELMSILNQYAYSFNDLESFLETGKYDKIDPANMVGNAYKKPLILCHGDMHAKNIILQDNRLMLIDAGGVGYKYWCVDVCRLLVNMFILGLDYDTVDYYDLAKIKDYYESLDSMLDLREMTMAVNRNGFLCAINWLIKNVKKIYKQCFTHWEFCLGLMAEFIKMTYKNETIPPNKRALCFLAAEKCLKKANHLCS